MHITSAGKKALDYTERVSKTFKGGLKDKGRKPRQARAYESDENKDRCLVTIFEKYLSVCPREGLEKSLYLLPLTKPRDGLLFSAVPIGRNTLGNIVKNLMKEAGFNGKYTNHSLRVTTATRLFNAHIPDQLIMNQTGHRSTSAVTKYKRPNESQLQDVTAIINGNKTTPADHEGHEPPSKQLKYSTATSTYVFNISGDNNNFNFKP